MRLFISVFLVCIAFDMHCGDDQLAADDVAASLSPLRAEPAEIDLGTLSIGSEKSFTVVLRNTSGGKVTIGKMRSDCACIDLQVARSNLEPGESTELSGRFRAGPHAGKIRKQATLEIHTPDVRYSRISLTGQVVGTLHLEPESVTLQPDFVNGIAAECSMTIRNSGSKPVHLTPGERFDHIALILERETLNPGETTTARISAEPEFVRSENHRVAIQTSHPHERTLHISLAIVPKPQLHLAPKVLRLGTLTKQEFLARAPYKVSLWGAGLQEFEVVKVDHPSFLRPELPVAEPNMPREMLFYGNDRATRSSLTGSVEIKLTHKATGKATVVKIPVYGTLHDGS